MRRWGRPFGRRWRQDRRGGGAGPRDETLFCRRGRFAQRAWSTSIVDVARGQLLDMVPGRTADGPARWLLRRPESWLEQIRWAVLDLSGPYRAAYDAAVPDAKQVADPFHVVRLANTALDEVRRRVQNQTLGHRGHAHDPLYRARKLLVSASENITEQRPHQAAGPARRRRPLRRGPRPPGTPKRPSEASMTSPTPTWAPPPSTSSPKTSKDPAMPPEINRLGRTISNWRHQIANWHAARVTNAATEAANNLIKRVKRVAFGFTNFNNYRIRALLYAGKPNWAPPRHPHSPLKSEEPPKVPIDRDAVNYGHCVSFGLSGCDINNPEATYDIMEDEGISGGYTDTPGYEDFQGDQPTTQANIGTSAWFDRCPVSRCGDGYTPPVPDLTNYYSNNNPVNHDPTCKNGYTVMVCSR